MKTFTRLLPTRAKPVAEPEPVSDDRSPCEEKKAVLRAHAAEAGRVTPDGLREFMEALERGDAVPSFPHRR